MIKVDNAEDKLIISKAEDTIYLSYKRFCPCFLGFLNEHQSSLIKSTLKLPDNCIFWGGYKAAKRVMFGSNVDKLCDFPFLCVKFTFKDEYTLSHRDFLGALMALGIDRSTIGDILVTDGQALVFVKSEIFDLIFNEISKIGRVGVKVSLCEETDIRFNESFDKLSFTLSSYRLDAFVSAVCHLSREKSQNMIKNDLVCVNHNPVNNISKQLKVNDVVTIRKYGKFEFSDEEGFSKKGRARISVNHFR